MTKKYLPRQRRVATGERPSMQLTSRDEAIIKAVNDYRVLLAAQIQVLFFTSRSAAQYRLVRLFQYGFLDRQFVPLPTGSTQATAPVYTVGRNGAKVLAERYGYSVGDIRVAKRDFSWWFVTHLLALNQVRLAIELGARAQGWLLERWEDERVFRANPDHVRLPGSGGKPAEKPVLPDGYFCLATPHGRAHHFLELDRGRESEAKFRPQIEVYEAYVASGQYQARYSPTSLRVLIVTTTDNRLKQLQSITAKAGGDRKYWFTTQTRVTPETALTGLIWQRLGSEERLPLVPV